MADCQSVASGFQYFVDCFEKSVSRISSEYFRLPRHGADPVFRERIYCYELYHQLRCCLGRWGYVLHGELDKGGHQEVTSALSKELEIEYSRCAPDFLVHKPGTHHSNLAVIEVKTSVAEPLDIYLDLVKIIAFMSNATTHYDYGLMVVFGEQPFPRVEMDYYPKWGEMIRTGISNGHLRIYQHEHPNEEPKQSSQAIQY